MSETISVADFESRLSDYLARVAKGGESFVLEDGGRVVAEVRPTCEGLPLTELPAVFASAPRLTGEEADEFARDLEEARAEMASVMPRDPWER